MQRKHHTVPGDSRGEAAEMGGQTGTRPYPCGHQRLSYRQTDRHSRREGLLGVQRACNVTKGLAEEVTLPQGTWR